MASHQRIVPVLLAGGTGSRLWPLSRENQPKPLLALDGERSLLQETAFRASGSKLFAPTIIVAGAAHAGAMAKELGKLDLPAPQFIIEPVGRDTGPAIAAAALVAKEAEPDPVLLVMPTDHRISDPDAFLSTVRRGMPAAKAGKLVLFGIRPDRPATGYGYVYVGEPLPYAGVFSVQRFVEKPDRETAERLLADGGALWNSGIFLMRADAILHALAHHAPDIVDHVRAALRNADRRAGTITLERSSFEYCPPLSFDRAVLEKDDETAVVPAAFGWSEVGSWSALWEVGQDDDAGNVAIGDVLTEATSGSYIRSEGPLVATLGVSNLIVIATPDAVLVADKNRDQEIKAIVERLRAKGSGAV